MREDGATPLVDHHVHGVVGRQLDRPEFELLINEGGSPPSPGLSHFDSPVGLAILMHCAPLLDLTPGCGADSYLERRAALGPTEVNRRFLQAADVSTLLVETGHRGDEVADPATMADLAQCPAFPVARIERVAEDVAARVHDPTGWMDALGPALADAASEGVGFKTIVA